MWQVFFRSISTFENLQKRGFIGPGCCVLCRADLESVSHLLLACPFAAKIWYTFSSKLAIWGPCHSDVQGFITDWQARNYKGDFCEFRVGLLHAIFWCIWGERNDRIFRDRYRTTDQTVWRIATIVGRWLRVADRVSQDDVRRWMSLWHHTFDPG
ncbi:hypothetical protein LINPERHAP1_LOCUS1269 [Linum perenne]